MNLLDLIREINGKISNFLQIRLININEVCLNIWSIIHLFSGFVVMLLINRKLRKFSYKYILLIEILILWELFEMFMRFTGMTFSGLFVFKMESVTDVLLDISFGMIGGFVYLIFSNKK